MLERNLLILTGLKSVLFLQEILLFERQGRMSNECVTCLRRAICFIIWGRDVEIPGGSSKSQDVVGKLILCAIFCCCWKENLEDSLADSFALKQNPSPLKNPSRLTSAHESDGMDPAVVYHVPQCTKIQAQGQDVSVILVGVGSTANGINRCTKSSAILVNIK